MKIEVQYHFPEQGTVSLKDGPIPTLMVSRFGAEDPHKGERLLSTAFLKIDEQGNPAFQGAIVTVPAVYYLPSTIQFLPEDLVTYYGELSKRNLEGHILAALQTDFPELFNISILPDGGTPGLFVGIKSIPDKKVPLATVSAGIARYLNILMAVIATEKGVVLIDEIENGLY